MNYRQVYRDFIADRRGRVVDGSVEVNHIVPRSLGGTDDPDNLVELPPGEHLFAHKLLWRIHGSGGPMASALFVMLNAAQYRGRSSRVIYAAARESAAVALGDRLRGVSLMPEHRAKIGAP